MSGDFAERIIRWIRGEEKPTLKRFIGKGGFGKVYYGEWKSLDVAVKKLCLSPQNTSESDLKDIKREIDILKSLRNNEYVIKYYDVYSDNQELLIIMDYAENGTLTKFINDNQNKDHDWNFNNNLIKQITQGLAYIHQENVIHRDLKSMNILLAGNYQVKISDFGLSKFKDINSLYSNYSAVKGTLRWMAPENLREKIYSKQSDVYALGMIMWEIAAKCTKPFKDVEDYLIGFNITNNKKETIPSDTPRNIYDIIQRCWKDNPSERISLAKIHEIIGNDEVKSQTFYTSIKSLFGFQVSKEDSKSSSPEENSKSYQDSGLLELDFSKKQAEISQQAQILQKEPFGTPGPSKK
ncbi:serine/threonine kinase [endosymbiont GvMRE of Glomus versiforme]|uniref:serine/threonine kinase n=1 Tax=endosymbiont GvMRE of Glomus versiforme TaxID=2039283 RepID=UPI000EBD41B3|nr:protein kinase [endosymbiont GvMRE of Glomus versiforme]RHZ37375.1 Tyrosine-protein kinase receptor [endosymbiont GvMRE of Glomus versiforme]